LKKNLLNSQKNILHLDFIIEFRENGGILVLEALDKNPKYGFLIHEIESKLHYDSVYLVNDSGFFKLFDPNSISQTSGRYMLNLYFFLYEPFNVANFSPLYLRRFRNKFTLDLDIQTIGNLSYTECKYIGNSTSVNIKKSLTFHGSGEKTVHINDSINITVIVIKAFIHGKKTYLYQIKDSAYLENFFVQGYQTLLVNYPNSLFCSIKSMSQNSSIQGTIIAHTHKNKNRDIHNNRLF
jgi:hypothetical protein